MKEERVEEAGEIIYSFKLNSIDETGGTYIEDQMGNTYWGCGIRDDGGIDYRCTTPSRFYIDVLYIISFISSNTNRLVQGLYYSILILYVYNCNRHIDSVFHLLDCRIIASNPDDLIDRERIELS